MARWKLVVEGDSDRDEVRPSARTFVDILRAQGHRVVQVTFYGDAERPGEDLTTAPVPPAPIVSEAPMVEATAEPEPTSEAPDAVEGN